MLTLYSYYLPKHKGELINNCFPTPCLPSIPLRPSPPLSPSLLSSFSLFTYLQPDANCHSNILPDKIMFPDTKPGGIGKLRKQIMEIYSSMAEVYVCTVSRWTFVSKI